MDECPEYRVRLFLSVDLVGSTAFKSNAIETDDLHPAWVERFRQFYKQFPEELESAYRETKSGLSGDDALINGGPKIWKTIGDEILFSCRILSVRHLSCCVSSFLDALDKFGRWLDAVEDKLDVKGSGWLATFPADNISISVQHGAVAVTSENKDYLTEDFEIGADKTPYKYDFLGKGMDAGFRISKNSSTDRFTSSLELSYILANANINQMFAARFSYHGRETFKGVIKNQPYPVITIDTERNTEKRNVRTRERILTQEPEVNPTALADFLESFMRYENIEVPALRLDPTSEIPAPPASYERFKKIWAIGVTETKQRDESVTAGETKENQDGSAHLSKSVKEFAKTVSQESLRPTRSIIPDDNLARRIRTQHLDLMRARRRKSKPAKPDLPEEDP